MLTLSIFGCATAPGTVDPTDPRSFGNDPQAELGQQIVYNCKCVSKDFRMQGTIGAPDAFCSMDEIAGSRYSQCRNVTFCVDSDLDWEGNADDRSEVRLIATTICPEDLPTSDPLPDDPDNLCRELRYDTQEGLDCADGTDLVVGIDEELSTNTATLLCEDEPIHTFPLESAEPPAEARISFDGSSQVEIEICASAFGLPAALCAIASPAVTGTLRLQGDLECEDAPCPIVLTQLGLRLEDFHIGNVGFWDGFSVTRARVSLVSAPTAALVGSILTVPPGSTFFVEGELDGVARVDSFTLTSPLFIHLNLATKDVSATLDLSDGGANESIVATLAGRLENVSPRANAGPDQIIECSGPTTPVTLDGSSTSDLDGDQLTFVWRSQERVATGESPTVELPLGEFDWRLEVVDAESAGSDSTLVRVADTTPPEVLDFTSNAPVCVWPPSHDYVVLRVGRDFDAIIDDVCDPDPFLQFASVSSNQADDGLGDGATSDDVVVFPDHVCVRSERSGVTGTREYTLSLQAVDASGNASDPQVDILVPHDQRQEVRCGVHLRDLETVREGDTLCDPERAAEAMAALRADTDPSTTGASRSTSSCSVTSTPRQRPYTWALLFLLGLIARRRDR